MGSSCADKWITNWIKRPRVFFVHYFLVGLMAKKNVHVCLCVCVAEWSMPSACRALGMITSC